MQVEDGEVATADARAWARSGAMALTGHRDGAPLYPHTRAAALVDELAAPFGLDSGLLSERAAMTGWRRQGQVTLGGGGRLLRAADGWMAMSLPRREDFELLPALIGLDAQPVQAWPAVAAWVAGRPGAEAVAQARLLGLAAGVVGEEPVAAPARCSPHEGRSVRDLEGCVVLDLSSLWAGPLCSHLLARAGARVIKVESTSRPDGARRGNADFYDLLNAGKESVALDLSSSSATRHLLALVERADVIVTSARARALSRLGMDPDAVAAGQVWVAITARGWGDDSVGFGDDVAAAAGLVAWDEGGEPCFAGDAIADPLCGVIAAAAVRRGATGFMDVSLQHAATAAMSQGTATALRATVAQAEAGEWSLWGEAVAAPRPRRPRERARDLGRDTAAVLAEMG